MPDQGRPEVTRSFPHYRASSPYGYSASSYQSSSACDTRSRSRASEIERNTEYLYDRPSSHSYCGCDVYYPESQDSLASRSDSDSQKPWQEDGDRPSTAHARLQRPWLPPRPETLPATSEEFAELFPSSRELRIQHDDATLDGNMNLKVDTTTTDRSGFARSIILFHLRMYELKSRDFSLRRYCRDSGREICHCARKSTKHPANEKFTVQRSLGQAFAALKSKADVFHHHNSSQSEVQKQPVELQRHDSGYDSTAEEEEEHDDASSISAESNSSKPNANSSDPIHIEFLNYAHVNVRRRGLKGHKRYDFDYWGEEYSWNVAAQKVGHLNELSYTLLRRRDGNVVARIFPQPLSEVEARAEAERGGWIAPCRMRITDEKLLVERNADLADVIVMTGLIALVDDGIRRHFHTSGIKQLVSPLSKLQAHRHRRATVMPVEKSGEAGVRR